MYTCKVCEKGSNSVKRPIREMMFGTRTTFDYFECKNCGCFQIIDIPIDMSNYYRISEYYSLKEFATEIKFLYLKKIVLWLKMRLNVKIINSINWILGAKFENYFKWIAYINDISYESKILDVGCGNGALLYEMRNLGFKNLYGVDPFVNTSKNENGLRIIKSDLNEIDGPYDLIMLHHSLEHMPNQCQVMQKLNNLLAIGGVLIIRVPVIDSYAWRTYGKNWYQIDAPRHFYLHSSNSLTILAKKYGFELIHSFRDSTGLQFLISEMYSKDISFNEMDKGLLAVSKNGYRKKADALNAKGDGDQACFIYRKYSTLI